MSQACQITPQSLDAVLVKLVGTLAACYPKAVLLFGSAVAFLQDPLANPAPRDLDILLVADNPLVDIRLEDFQPPVELHRFRSDEVCAVARSLRYDRRAVALTKLYAKNVVKQHARDVILASILLGPSYNAFGIEQIDVGARIDTRDYSRHIVLYGQEWWQGLTRWARRRRNLMERLADKLVMADRFC
jgi:predicted nucleotidyltransferase